MRDLDTIFKLTKTAGTQVLDLEWVEKLRKDCLTLLKNLPRVKDYESAIDLDEAFRIYSTRFDDLFFDRFLNKQLKYEHDKFGISESDAKYLDTKLRGPAWSFILALRLPISHKDDYWTAEARFSQYEKSLKTWEAKLRRTAQVFWKSMKETLEWTNRHSPGGLPVHVPSVDNATIEGFTVIMRGYDPSNPDDPDTLEKLKAALKIYRKNAAARLPLLLKKQRPLIVEFERELDKGGEYYSRNGGEIQIWASGAMGASPAGMAHVIAHEMGHHLFRTSLGGNEIAFWNEAISNNYGPLDIAELLQKWPGDAWAFDMPKYLASSDPILALQVQALSHDRALSLSGKELQTKEDFQRLYDRGERTLRVPKIPITGYANKNPEEAFCEAIGLLVGYGPRAVHEVVHSWLSIVLPGDVKTASTDEPDLTRVAALHMKTAGYFNPGDLVVFGKYKNKRAIIKAIAIDERGVPVVTLEPVPKGRKGDKVLGLFNIWHADLEKRKSFGT